MYFFKYFTFVHVYDTVQFYPWKKRWHYLKMVLL
jgi:hypothetical protein